MRPDPVRPSSSFGSLGGSVSRIVWALLFLVGLAGCGLEVGTGTIDFDAICLERHPGDVRCCSPTGHVERRICCSAGYHEVSDVEHADWSICIPDADAGAELDAGAEAE